MTFILSAFLLAGIVVMFLLWIGTFVLQIFLSKADNPWVGLILPGITFGLILYISTMAPDFSTAWIGLSRGNIATAIYLLIYFFFRKRKKKSNLDSKTKTEKGVFHLLGRLFGQW